MNMMVSPLNQCSSSTEKKVIDIQIKKERKEEKREEERKGGRKHTFKGNIKFTLRHLEGFPVAQLVKNPPALKET